MILVYNVHILNDFLNQLVSFDSFIFAHSDFLMAHRTLMYIYSDHRFILQIFSTWYLFFHDTVWVHKFSLCLRCCLKLSILNHNQIINLITFVNLLYWAGFAVPPVLLRIVILPVDGYHICHYSKSLLALLQFYSIQHIS